METDSGHLNRSRKLLLAGLSALLVAFFAANVLLGSVRIPLSEVWAVFTGNGNNEVYSTILLTRRIPETVCALVAGAGLAVCGLLMQTLFRNPLADPSILGISSGATLAVAVVTFLSGFLSLSAAYNPYVQFSAALIGSVAVLLLLLAAGRRLYSNTALLITGIMIGYITSSLVSVLQYAGQKDANYSFIMWTYGSFSRAVWGDFFLLFAGLTTAGVAASFFLIKALNTLLLGENYAKNLGLNISRVKLVIIVLCAFITGVITAYCGPIAFIGLAVPHIVKLMTQTANRRVILPFTVLAGAVIALGCNIFTKLPDLALPINAVTSLIGAPIVISALLRNNSSAK